MNTAITVVAIMFVAFWIFSGIRKIMRGRK
jgi:hypothetical protein